MQEEKPDSIKELMVLLRQWREKYNVRYRKIEVKIKEDVAFVSVTGDYTPQDFAIKG